MVSLWRPSQAIVRICVLGISAISTCMTASMLLLPGAWNVVLPFILITSASAMAVPAVIVAVGWRVEAHETRSLILVTWMAMMVAITAKMHTAILDPNKFPYYMPIRDFVLDAGYSGLPYAWSMACLLHTTAFPLAFPRNRRDICGTLALLVGTALILFFISYHSCVGGQQDINHLGFLSNESNEVFPVFLLVTRETVHFLETGDGEGALAMVFILALSGPAKDLLFEFKQGGGATGLFHPEEDGGTIVTLLSTIQAVLVICATFRPRTAFSTDARFIQQLNEEEDVNSYQQQECGLMQRLRVYAGTFVGKNAAFAANGLFCVIVYSAKQWPKPDEWIHHHQVDEIRFSGQYVISGILGFATATIVVALWNIVVGAMSLSLPIDDHFRFLTMLKALMAWYKLEVLNFIPARFFAMKSIALQIASIVGSICCGMGVMVPTLLSGYRSDDFRRKYWKPDGLIFGTLISVTFMWVLNGLVIASKAFGRQYAFHKLITEADVALMMTLPSVFVIPFFCFANEVACSIFAFQSKGNPSCFEGVASTRGVIVLAAFASIKFGLQCLGNIVASPLVPSFLSAMFEGTGETGWAAACATYITLGLIAGAAVACFSVGPPSTSDGVDSFPLALQADQTQFFQPATHE